MPTTMTSQSHDLPVPQPTGTQLLDIADFGQVKINDITQKHLQKNIPK